MALFGKGRHRSGETAGQDKVRKHGQEPARRKPAPLCQCGSGLSAYRCDHKRLKSGRDRIPTQGRGRTTKWGTHRFL